MVVKRGRPLTLGGEGGRENFDREDPAHLGTFGHDPARFVEDPHRVGFVGRADDVQFPVERLRARVDRHVGANGCKFIGEVTDLIILDVVLPKRDGWSLMTELRRAEIHTPVLFLTACDSVPDRVKGFDLGADDYLITPFHFSELLARVRSLLRRSPERKEETLTVGDLETIRAGTK